MKPVNRTVLAFVVGVVLAIPLTVVGEALDFASLAWIPAVLALLLLVSLIDREGFYGPRSQ